MVHALDPTDAENNVEAKDVNEEDGAITNNGSGYQQQQQQQQQQKEFLNEHAKIEKAHPSRLRSMVTNNSWCGFHKRGWPCP